MARMISIIGAVVVIVAASGLAPVSEAAEATDPGAAAFEHVHALAFDAAAHSLWLGAQTGLFRSEDCGQTWTKVTPSPRPDALDVTAVTPDPRDAGTLYIGTHEAGVLKTVDGGRNWSEVNDGLRGCDVHGLAIAPDAPARLHTLVRDKGEGVYRTTNGGQNGRTDFSESGLLLRLAVSAIDAD